MKDMIFIFSGAASAVPVFYALIFLKNILTWNSLCKALTVSDKSMNLSET